MPPPERQTSPVRNRRGSQDTDDVGTTSITRDRTPSLAHRSPTLAYLASRERVLGRGAWVPLTDPAETFAALCEALGGRQLAGAYVRQMLAELPPCAWPVDPDGNRFDYAALYEATG